MEKQSMEDKTYEEAGFQIEDREVARSRRRTRTIGCPDEAQDAECKLQGGFIQRRRSTVVGIEQSPITRPHFRRSSTMGSDGFSRLSHRRAGTISDEPLLGAVAKAAAEMSQHRAASRASSPNGSSSTCPSSSEDGDATGRTAASSRMSFATSRRSSKASTLQNATEASRLREELTLEGQFGGRQQRRRSSVIGCEASDIARRNTLSMAIPEAGFTERFQRRSSFQSARFRTQGTLDVMNSLSHECVKRVQIFKFCDLEFVELLKEFIETRIFNANCEIVREAEPLSSFYVLVHGTVELFVGETTVETLEEGSAFGEEVVLSEGLSCVTARAKTFCDCRAIARDGLLRAMKAFPASKRVLVANAKQHVSALHRLGNSSSVADAEQDPTQSCPAAFWHPGFERRESRPEARHPRASLPALNFSRSTASSRARTKETPEREADAEEQPPRRFSERRRSSVIGFETSSSDRRRSLGQSSGLPFHCLKGLPHRRSSVIGCEASGGFLQMLSPMHTLLEVPEAAGAGSESSSLPSSNSSNSSSCSSSSDSTDSSDSDDTNDIDKGAPKEQPVAEKMPCQGVLEAYHTSQDEEVVTTTLEKNSLELESTVPLFTTYESHNSDDQRSKLFLPIQKAEGPTSEKTSEEDITPPNVKDWDKQRDDVATSEESLPCLLSSLRGTVAAHTEKTWLCGAQTGALPGKSIKVCRENVALSSRSGSSAGTSALAAVAEATASETEAETCEDSQVQSCQPQKKRQLFWQRLSSMAPRGCSSRTLQQSFTVRRRRAQVQSPAVARKFTISRSSSKRQEDTGPSKTQPRSPEEEEYLNMILLHPSAASSAGARKMRRRRRHPQILETLTGTCITGPGLPTQDRQVFSIDAIFAALDARPAASAGASLPHP